MNDNSTERLMTDLVADLAPIKPLKFANGALLALAGFGVAVALVFALGYPRSDVMAGQPAEVFLLATGLFVFAAAACATAALLMASPRVGSARNGWQWAVAMLGLLPVAALLAIFSPQTSFADNEAGHGVICLTASLGLGLIIGGLLTAWLRRGAPTSPERAGWVVGLASGAAGIAAFSFSCPYDSVLHLGIWHFGAVAISAVIGRFAVPPLVRW